MVTLVTGAGGSVGRLLVTRMVAQKRTVRVMVRNNQSAAQFANVHGVEVVLADLTKPPTLDQATNGVRNIIHLGGYLNSMTDVKMNNQVNEFGTRALLEAAIKNKVQRIIMTSTNNVYGRQSKEIEDGLEPVTEHSPTNTKTAYGLSKLAAEKILLENTKVETVILRPGVILGEVKVGTEQLGRVLLRGWPTYLENGYATMNLIDVQNLLDMLLLAMEKREAIGQIYNAVDTTKTFQSVVNRLASEIGRTAHSIRVSPYVVKKITDLLELLSGTGRPISLIGTAINAGKYATTHSRVSSDKARKECELGWKPRRTFEQTMDASGKYLRQVFGIKELDIQ